MYKNKIKNLLNTRNVMGLCNHLKSKYPEIYNEVLQYASFSTGKFTEKLYLYINELTEIPKCKICGNNTKFLDFTRGFQPTCSRKCAHKDPKRTENAQKTCLQKYGNITATGSQSYKEKVKQTCLQKYGTEHHLQKGSLIRDKIEKTNQKRYGGKSPFSSNDVQDTWRKNMLEKYGVDNPLKDSKIKDKAQKTHQVKLYNTIKESFKYSKPNFSLDLYLSHGFGYENIYDWECQQCKEIFKSYYANGTEPLCPKCFPKFRSKGEFELQSFIESLGINTESNNRTLLKGDEIDIIVPKLKIAFEFNGNYYHSESLGKSKHYHISKTERMDAIGWQLIHIFEDEWIYKQDIIKSKIKHILLSSTNKIYARKCTIKIIDTKAKNSFLNEYHLQGADKSNIKLGLFLEEKLVAVMTFCKARKSLRHTDDSLWELSRYACIGNVVGGAGKLFKHFIRNYKIERVITYADRRFTNLNNVYEKLGFTLDHISPPCQYIFENGNYHIRHSRLKYQKHKLSKLLKEYNENLTVWENLKIHGYDRIWDCGNYVYMYHTL